MDGVGKDGQDDQKLDTFKETIKDGQDGQAHADGSVGNLYPRQMHFVRRLSRRTKDGQYCQKLDIFTVRLCEHCGREYTVRSPLAKWQPKRKYCSRPCYAASRRGPRGAPRRRNPYGWQQTRRTVWERDRGRCHVCGDDVTFDAAYHCGHIVDLWVGGSNDLDNLVVMCSTCNLKKPFHSTKEDYERWRASYTRFATNGIPRTNEDEGSTP